MPNLWIGNRENDPFRIESEAGFLKLPSVFIESEDINQPAVSIRSIRVRIQGAPMGLVILGPAYATNTDLKVFEPPRKLNQRIECLPYTTNLKNQVFPAGQYLMRVEVLYQPAPAFPGAKPGRELTATLERYLEVPGILDRECTLRANWQHQELTVGVNIAELVIHAENLPRGAVISTSVHDPKGLLIPALRETINQQLSLSGPVLLQEQKKELPASFHQKIGFRFDVPERARASSQSPIAVELRVTVKKAVENQESVELSSFDLTGSEALIVDFPENMFPGFPILDLGTSSTFAVIYFSSQQAGFLPTEQEQTIRTSLRNWLDRKDGPFGMPEWKTLLGNTAWQLGDSTRGGSDPVASVRNYLKNNPPRPSHTDHGLHRLIKAFELSAMAPNLSVPFRIGLRREIFEMYTNAFRRFPLEQQRLIGVELDKLPSTEGDSDRKSAMVAPIPSTIAIQSTNPFAVEIGFVAESARRAAGIANPESLLTQFHSSPKIYYTRLGEEGARIDVSVNGSVEAVTPRAFLVASLKRLRQSIESFRDESEHPKLPRKRFSKIVLPFPTSAPLSVRLELLAAAREAGFDRPIAELDEALSAIVFYLVNPFGADLEMGLEAFRTSCRATPRGGQFPVEWKQNVLLIDIGGGTTDIALIEVTLEDVQAKGAGDGSKGRYYRLVPKLLGATGKDQLAGNVLSLGVFHVVKVRIADAILSALDPVSVARAATIDSRPADPAGRPNPAAEETANLDRLFKAASKVPKAFQDGTADRYQAGKLLAHYSLHQLWISKSDDLAPLAFRYTDQILPTAWKSASDEQGRSAAARSFHLLWQIAESFKINVFSSISENSSADAVVTVEEVAALLGLSVATCQQHGLGPVVIRSQDILSAINPPLEEIAKLALDMTVNSLRRDSKDAGILDRIVLTGQTCRLGRVREVMKAAFRVESDSPVHRLRWDPTCLTFQGEYAKQAAAFGAAYARILIEDRVSPKFDRPLNGNVLDINIQNFFFFLQSGFYVRRAREENRLPVLSPGEPFREFDGDGVGLLRSDWLIDPSEMLYIDRFDFPSDPGVPWGHFDCKLLVDQLGVSLGQFQENTVVAIEADHRLIVSVLFCWGKECHYELPLRGEKIDIPDILRQARLIPPAKGPAERFQAPGTDAVSSTIPTPPLVEWMETLGDWVVGVNVRSALRNENLFRLTPSVFKETLRHPTDKSKCRGVQSDALPDCPESGVDKFYVRPNDASRDWIQIGELVRPTEAAGRQVSARAVLDERGCLRVVLGGLSLSYAATDKELLDPGVVLRKALTSSPRIPEELRDPFCGRH